MTTETILTDEEVREILRRAYNYPLHIHVSDIRAWRAIEQAVLQSSEIQALKRDKERLDWLESSKYSHGFCHAGFGDYIYYAHQQAGYKTVREVIDSAMEDKS